jgi:hypothetical protein
MGCVYALERVVPGLAGVIDGDIVPPMCLVNVYVALRGCNCFCSFMCQRRYLHAGDRTYRFTHVIPVLGGMDAGS